MKYVWTSLGCEKQRMIFEDYLYELFEKDCIVLECKPVVFFTCIDQDK